MKTICEATKDEIIDWAIEYVRGFGVPSTVHYNGIIEIENIEEWAVPLSHLEQIKKDLHDTIKDCE